MNSHTAVLKSASTVPHAPTAGLAPSLERKRLRVYLIQMVTDIGLLLGSCQLVG